MESKHHKRYYALCFSPFDVQEEEDQDNQLEADWEVPQKVLAPEKIWESDRSLAGKDVQNSNALDLIGGLSCVKRLDTISRSAVAQVKRKGTF